MLGPQSAVRVSKKSGPHFYLEKWKRHWAAEKICGKNINENYAERGWVERVFSWQKSILTKARAQLSPEIVKKMLFVRYNAKKLGDHAFSQFSQAVPDEWYFEELEPEEPSET